MGLSRECCCLCFSVLLFFLSIFVIVRRCAHSQGLSFWFRWRVTGAVPCLPSPAHFILMMCLPLFLLLTLRIHILSATLLILSIMTPRVLSCPVPLLTLRVLRLYFLRMFICSNRLFLFSH